MHSSKGDGVFTSLGSNSQLRKSRLNLYCTRNCQTTARQLDLSKQLLPGSTFPQHLWIIIPQRCSESNIQRAMWLAVKKPETQSASSTCAKCLALEGISIHPKHKDNSRMARRISQGRISSSAKRGPVPDSRKRCSCCGGTMSTPKLWPRCARSSTWTPHSHSQENRTAV